MDKYQAENRVELIFRKIGVKRRIEIVKYVIKNKIYKLQ